MHCCRLYSNNYCHGRSIHPTTAQSVRCTEGGGTEGGGTEGGRDRGRKGQREEGTEGGRDRGRRDRGKKGERGRGTIGREREKQRCLC